MCVDCGRDSPATAALHNFPIKAYQLEHVVVSHKSCFGKTIIRTIKDDNIYSTIDFDHYPCFATRACATSVVQVPLTSKFSLPLALFFGRQHRLK